MFVRCTLALAVSLVLTLGLGCGGGGDGDADGDVDGDADGDADSDSDGDADGDADGDSDGDADGDSDGDADGDGDADPPECSIGGGSDLTGVTIVFPEQPCVFTLAEAAAGIEIAYQVVVAADVSGVAPAAQDAGRCERPGPSGLITHEVLAGGGQVYCVCASGRCMPPSEDSVTIAAGTTDHTFSWTGRNWGGPSDTGNPLGEPFPAGEYTLTVSATGTKDGEAFTVTGTFLVTLVP